MKNIDLADLLFRRVPKGPARNACWSLFLWGLLLTGLMAGLVVTRVGNRAYFAPSEVAFLVVATCVGLCCLTAPWLLERRQPLGKVLAWAGAVPSLICIPAGTFAGGYAIAGLTSHDMQRFYATAAPMPGGFPVAPTPPSADDEAP